MTDLPDVAFKILSRADWRAALAEGRYDGSAVDLADGYIHLSAADQLEATAAKHYAGQTELMLVEVDLTARIRQRCCLVRAGVVGHLNPFCGLGCASLLDGSRLRYVPPAGGSPSGAPVVHGCQVRTSWS